uniref:Uncharacterized protein n=1 Tax=Onchocerca volvulus TaxID=6282 RepID=A0A8R1XW10_ONCVO
MRSGTFLNESLVCFRSYFTHAYIFWKFIPLKKMDCFWLPTALYLMDDQALSTILFSSIKENE